MEHQKTEVRTYFDKDPEGWQGGLYADTSQAFSSVTQRRKQYTLEWLQRSGATAGANKRALDIGCGSGVYLPDVSQFGFTTFGMDFSSGMFSAASRVASAANGQGAIHILGGDIESLPFREKSLDLVLCIGVLDYLVNDRRAIAEMHRVLGAGGVAAVSIRNAISASNFVHFILRNLRRRFGVSSGIDEGQPGISFTIEWILRTRGYRYKMYNLRKFDQLMQEGGFGRLDGVTFGYELKLLRRLRLPERIARKIEIGLELFCRSIPLGMIRNSGLAYIGVYRKLA